MNHQAMTQSAAPKAEGPAASPPAARPAHIGFRRFSTAEFLLALVLLFIVTPIVEDIPHGRSIEISLMTLVLVAGVLAVGRSHRTLVWAAVLVAPVVTARWIHHFFPDLGFAKVIFLVAGLVYLIFLVVQFLHFILRAPRVNAEVLYAGISVYLLLGLVWTLAYSLVAKLIPNSFAFSPGPGASQTMEGFTAYYFSFVTLTTVGYGDITPVSNAARALAALEAMTGTLYVAVLISRLVALYSSEKLPPGEQPTLPEDNKLSTRDLEKE
jgi:hypothetical protein